MRAFWHNFRGAVRRVFPNGTAQAQAVAFNMFLSFFPMLLLVFGVLTSSRIWGGTMEELHTRLVSVLPPGSGRLVENLIHRGQHPVKWGILGLAGTLLAGTQVMVGLLEGVRMVSGGEPARYWRQQWRGLWLLFVGVGPWLVIVAFTVFGKQLSNWMIRHFGLPGFFHALWAVVYLGLVLVLGVLVLAVIYRGGRSKRGWNEVLPGAVVATLLWWAVNSAFGLYVRHVPYGPIYGGLAAAIGLMVWMYLSVLVVLVGAAYNAEAILRSPTTPVETVGARAGGDDTPGAT